MSLKLSNYLVRSQHIDQRVLSAIHANLYDYLLDQLSKERGGSSLFIEELLLAFFLALENGSLAFKLSILQMQELERYSSSYITIISDDQEYPKGLLVIANGYLYLQRYYLIEQNLKRELYDKIIVKSQNTQLLKLSEVEQAAEIALWQSSLGGGEHSDLLVAGKILLQSDFLLLSGGPGTGKTYSLGKLLILLNQVLMHKGMSLKLLLSAPTARAMARMRETLRDLELIHLELEIATLHKALGYHPENGFRYNKNHQLAYDFVIIDEMSMVDAYLFLQLLEALPQRAKLLLIGDADQLPSVDSGSVFADLVYWDERRREYLKPGDQLIIEKSSFLLSNNIQFLTKSYRSSSTILRLAKAFLHQSTKIIEEYVHKGKIEEVEIKNLPDDAREIYRWIADQYSYAPQKKLGNYSPHLGLSSLQKGLVKEFFLFYDNFIVIAPLHAGAYGVATLNKRISEIIGGEQPIYHGLPVVLTMNQLELGLSNGDKGLVLQFGETYYMLFKEGTDSFKILLPSEVKGYDIAYSITVHKSQGSEYARVVILLPESANRLLSAQLVYTALTRAKESVTLWAEWQVGMEITRAHERESRLKESLLAKL